MASFTSVTELSVHLGKFLACLTEFTVANLVQAAFSLNRIGNNTYKGKFASLVLSKLQTFAKIVFDTQARFEII